MAKDLRTLPKGKWIHLSGLAPETTEEDVATFLYAHGFDVTEEHVSIRYYSSKPGAHAMVAIPNEVLITLLNWAINGDALHNRPVVAADFHVLDKSAV